MSNNIKTKTRKINWGETLWEVSQALGIKTEDLRKMQGDGFKMIAGKTMEIPDSSQSQQSSSDDVSEGKIDNWYDEHNIDRPTRWSKARSKYLKKSNTSEKNSPIVKKESSRLNSGDLNLKEKNSKIKENASENKKEEPRRGAKQELRHRIAGFKPEMRKESDITNTTDTTDSAKDTKDTSTKNISKYDPPSYEEVKNLPPISPLFVKDHWALLADSRKHNNNTTANDNIVKKHDIPATNNTVKNNNVDSNKVTYSNNGGTDSYSAKREGWTPDERKSSYDAKWEGYDEPEWESSALAKRDTTNDIGIINLRELKKNKNNKNVSTHYVLDQIRKFKESLSKTRKKNKKT